MTQKIRDIANDVMEVRDRLDPEEMVDERNALLHVRDQIAQLVDQVGEDKPSQSSRKSTSAKKQTKVSKSTKTSKPSTKTAAGQGIKEARLNQEMTRRDLARAAGISELSLRKIEEGQTQRPHEETIKKISKALGMETASPSKGT